MSPISPAAPAERSRTGQIPGFFLDLRLRYAAATRQASENTVSEPDLGVGDRPSTAYSPDFMDTKASTER